MGADNIILGEGVFSVGNVDIALTRGGGEFAIEREYKTVEADGDRGPVKGRIRLVKSVAELKLNALELLPANLPKLYPAMSLDTSDTGKDVLTAATDIVTGDYNDTVAFTGTTKAGKQVYIELQNAINLEKINWKLQDKDELVPEINYTATYLENARTTEPWKIEIAKGTTYTVTFTVDDGSNPISGASVTYHNETKATNGSGVAAFTGVEVGTNQSYTVVAGGYNTVSASVTVDGIETVGVSMTEV